MTTGEAGECRAFRIFRLSQLLRRRLLAPPSPDRDEVLFIDFRPHWLVAQQSVYRALSLFPCSICMLDVFVEQVAVQHNPRHPPICRACFERLKVCPFCRTCLGGSLDRYGRVQPRRLALQAPASLLLQVR